MSNGDADWYDRDKKRAAILRVLRYLIAHRDIALECIGRDGRLRALFEDAAIGNIHVPEGEGARTIIFATGETALGAGGSVSIEMPPPEVTPASNLTDDELISYALNYVHWSAGQ